MVGDMIALAFLALIVAVALMVHARRLDGPATKPPFGERYDESDAPLAPRSGASIGGWNPTERQIQEDDLPRVVEKDGTVRQIEQDEFGKWS